MFFDSAHMTYWGQLGAYMSIGLASFGSSFGAAAASLSAAGAWKKCALQNRPAPFQLVIFAGSPISQTIYGMIVMFLINNTAMKIPGAWLFLLVLGLTTGILLGLSAWLMGKYAASACDAFGETGKGFTNYLILLGIIETVAIFVFAFAAVLLASLKGPELVSAAASAAAAVVPAVH
ncbi:MAG: hypothetical protein A2X49_11405 [Lentisphaerae bacterium GWF2_52_8]|nr:MAG: hypothetical protein A2X49_11405 [Lentisphaerae bacterium GWF2_52_8]